MRLIKFSGPDAVALDTLDGDTHDGSIRRSLVPVLTEAVELQNNETISQMLDIPGVRAAVLAAIPTDWEWSSGQGGDSPTPEAFARQFLSEIEGLGNHNPSWRFQPA